MKLTKSILKELIKEEMSEIADAVVFNTGSKALKDADAAGGGEFEEMIMDNSPDTGDMDEEALYDAVRAKIGLGGDALEEIIREELQKLYEQAPKLQTGLTIPGRGGSSFNLVPPLRMPNVNLDMSKTAAAKPTPAKTKRREGPPEETPEEKAEADRMEKALLSPREKELKDRIRRAAAQKARAAEPAKQAPARAIAKFDPNNRRSINAAWKRGDISKDEWRTARRALARKLRKQKRRRRRRSTDKPGGSGPVAGIPRKDKSGFENFRDELLRRIKSSPELNKLRRDKEIEQFNREEAARRAGITNE